MALFSANDPRTLIDEARDRTKLAESVAEGLALFQGISAREAVVYEGADIIQRVADKSLSSESGSTVYFLGASKFGSQLNLERYWKRYHTRRVGLDISCKILYDKDTPQEIVANRNVIGLCEAKYMPFGLDLPMWLVIFEDHVAMVVPGEEPPLAFVVKSQKTADGFRKYFEYLWKQ